MLRGITQKCQLGGVHVLPPKKKRIFEKFRLVFVDEDRKIASQSRNIANIEPQHFGDEFIVHILVAHAMDNDIGARIDGSLRVTEIEDMHGR